MLTLPLPKKPVRTVTGMRLLDSGSVSDMAGGVRYLAQNTAFLQLNLLGWVA